VILAELFTQIYPINSLNLSRFRQPFSRAKNMHKSSVVRLAGGALVAAGSVVSAGVAPSRAADRIDNQAIQFDTDTVVEFEFLRANNMFRSSFGVINLQTNERTPLIQETRASDDNRPVSVGGRQTDFLSTPGQAVPQPTNEFKFVANTPYAFYLESTTATGRRINVFSTDANNPGGRNHFRFERDGSALAGGGGVLFSIEDNPGGDFDYNDFQIVAGGNIGCACKPLQPTATAPEESFQLPPSLPRSAGPRTGRRIRGRG
jgi:hypothetical protein